MKHPLTSIPVWTSASEGFAERVNALGNPLRPPVERYSNGACERGLPWQDAERTRCSGDCHR